MSINLDIIKNFEVDNLEQISSHIYGYIHVHNCGDLNENDFSRLTYLCA